MKLQHLGWDVLAKLEVEVEVEVSLCLHHVALTGVPLKGAAQVDPGLRVLSPWVC